MNVGNKYLVMLIFIVSAVKTQSDFQSLEALTGKTYTDNLVKCFSDFGKISALAKEKQNAEIIIIAPLIITTITDLLIFFNLFEGQENKYAHLIFFAYQTVPYHNICHGLVVGLYSASIFIKNNNITNKQVQLAQLSILFYSGLLHDVNHSGTRDAYYNIEGKQSGNPNPFDYIGSDCVVNQNTASIPIKKYFALHNFITTSNEKLELTTLLSLTELKITENCKINGIDCIKVLEANIAYAKIVIENVFPINVKNEVLPIICKSSEFIHSIIAKLIFVNYYKEAGDVFTESIVASILGTNMNLLYRKTPIHINNNFIDLKIVHIADLMGVAAFSSGLRDQLLEQLQFEFAFDLKTVLEPKNDFLGIAKDDKGEISLSKNFVGSQNGFFGTIQNEIFDAGLATTPFFLGTEDVKGYNTLLSEIKTEYTLPDDDKFETKFAALNAKALLGVQAGIAKKTEFFVI